MSNSLFSQESQLQPVSKNLWECNFTRNWLVGEAINGGFTMAVAAKAMAQEVHHPHPITITGYYLNVTEPTKTQVATEVVRQGRNISTVQAKVIQGDKECVRLIGSFADLHRPSGETFMEQAPPELPPPEQCYPISANETPVEVNNRFDILVPNGYLEKIGTASNVSEFKAWIKFKDTDLTDTFALCLFSDAFMPAIFNRVGLVAWVPTLELNVQIRDVPVAGLLRCRFRTRFLSNGTLEEDGEIWDQSDKLVALSRQTAKLRIPKK